MRNASIARRSFVGLLGSAVAWPLTARAESVRPVVGFLRSTTPASSAHIVAAWRQGLADAGYIEGQNLVVEYRWADDQPERLPALASDLVRRRVRIIVASGGHLPAFAARDATKTIPIVFIVGDDPVELGLVASLNRPGGNLTGVTQFTGSLEPKRLQLLRELAPAAKLVGVLTNPQYPRSKARVKEVQAAADALGLKTIVFPAADEPQLANALSSAVAAGAKVLLAISDPFYFSRRKQLVALAAQYAVPTIYQSREFADAGGLVSYGSDLVDAYRQSGRYIDQLLKGADPAFLPVEQSTKVQLVINLKVAKALGLSIPDSILLRADEVIE